MTIHEHDPQGGEQELTVEQKLAKLRAGLAHAADLAVQMESHQDEVDQIDMHIKALEAEAREHQTQIDQFEKDRRDSASFAYDLTRELINSGAIQGREAIQLVADVQANTSARPSLDETTLADYQQRLEQARAGEEVFVFDREGILVASGVIEGDTSVEAVEPFDGGAAILLKFSVVEAGVDRPRSVAMPPRNLEFSKEAAIRRYLEKGPDKAGELFLRNHDYEYDHAWALGELLKQAAAFRSRCDAQDDERVSEYHESLAEHSIDFICNRLMHTYTKDIKQLAQWFAQFAPEKVPEVVAGMVPNTAALNRHEDFLTTMIVYQKGTLDWQPNDIELAEARVEVLKMVAKLHAEQQPEQE